MTRDIDPILGLKCLDLYGINFKSASIFPTQFKMVYFNLLNV